MALRYEVVYYHRQLESGKVDVMTGNESLADENGGQARRKAVMAVLAPFNLGEAAVSRAAVRLSTGEVGFGYTLGRDREKARLIALCDAMVQSAELAGAIETQVVAPLRAAMIERRNRKAEEAAATRVDFYTLVRGEG